jgi:ABC-2 type transport system permease protein
MVNISHEDFIGEKSIKDPNEIKNSHWGGLDNLIMMFIIIYGNMVMRSVIEENKRIIEIITHR